MVDGRIEVVGSPAEAITESTVSDEFGLPCIVAPDPISDAPMIVPHDLCTLRSNQLLTRRNAPMSVVKINAVTVPEGMGEEFIDRFAKRAGSVENQPGFEEFLLLRPTDDNGRFFVFTRWESEEAFQGWLASRDFAAAHAHVGEGDTPPAGHGSAGPVAASAELLAFEVMERVTKT